MSLRSNSFKEIFHIKAPAKWRNSCLCHQRSKWLGPLLKMWFRFSPNKILVGSICTMAKTRDCYLNSELPLKAFSEKKMSFLQNKEKFEHSIVVTCAAAAMQKPQKKTSWKIHVQEIMMLRTKTLSVKLYVFCKCYGKYEKRNCICIHIYFPWILGILYFSFSMKIFWCTNIMNVPLRKLLAVKIELSEDWHLF